MGFGDFLSKRMQKSIEKNMKNSTLNEENIKETLKEIRLSLLEADVNIEATKEIINNVKQKALGGYIFEGANAHQQMIKIVHEELVNILGKENAPLELNKKPSVVMMVGLQGSGKTTTANKLAYLLNKKNKKKVLLVGLDIYRPGAIEQLIQLGQKTNIQVFEKGKQDPILTAQEALEYAQENNFDVVILDTAGRLQVDQVLMTELDNLKKKTSPSEILLVVDGMSGQEIINVTNEFNSKLKLSGVVVTKLDGDARGGATLSISYLTKLPIKFIGEGEGYNALAAFYPKRMADRLMGMGDIETLFEKAVENIDERSIQKTMNRMFLGQFDLEDLRNQLAQIAKMGSLNKLMKMLPINKVSETQIQDAQRKLAVFSILMDSMTLKERRDPRVLKAISRKNRIIKGSGRTEKEFNELINSFEKGKKQVLEITKMIKSGRMPNLSKGGFKF
ncbi:signal recognition particle protein [Mycoplasma mycoides subsp. mycoides]|uniref:Signal recognition particle protein n=2 Tax=Mycoplasma mycoides subsp. mycoides TaxID=2103 RepID=Q6MTI5_MYCMS|nr:signal recognition particle protein [Mycoplasma mycoides]CAE77051.1 Signal recognition particle M54 protein [Mycoplasma mycoides subsp. mycoides SC str. PG1]ADK69283.1 signal recognition particle protein [Mycoplasma mycoides subsp. mycoides SC str. Gladysdale]AIZ55285.1 signal recognition particle protein [Mycoplasma mycoides subsp. mycoides]AME10631.1 Signal recognition particle M54 protein [Mycoplasma mycoides subsp. mycoides]AME11641.1 Signal recognition particle M54 protein [Mycoplasma 